MILRINLLVLVSTLSLGSVQGYVTSYSAVPMNKQVAWLKQLTGNILESPTGELTDEMIEAAPEIMKGWRSSKSGGTENALAVETLVKRLVDENKAGNTKISAPSTSDYNTVLEGWARSGAGSFAAERCEQILTEMEERYHAGDTNVQPNLSSFKATLMAWRDSNESYSAIRAQRVLEWMIRLHAEGSNKQVLPDSDCFDIVLQSWSRSKDSMAPHHAEKLLGRMEEVSKETQSLRLKPRTVSFNAVMGSWHKSSDKLAYKRVCDILEFMEHLCYEENNFRLEPDAATYNIVMSSLTKGGDVYCAEKADKLLRGLEKRFRSDHLSWQPDTILFNSAMGLWAKSNVSGAYRKARSILDRQVLLHEKFVCKSCQPDVFGYTSVISSCAMEPGDRAERAKAFNVALSTFHELDQNADEAGAANHVTYGTMLKACARLLPKGTPLREQWTRKVFANAVENGQVGDMVLSRLREALSQQEFKEIMQGHSRSTLPAAWTRNVNEKSIYRRKVDNRKRAEV